MLTSSCLRNSAVLVTEIIYNIHYNNAHRYNTVKTPNTVPLGGKQNGTVLGVVHGNGGGGVLGFLQYLNEKRERMVALYSGGRYWAFYCT